tara:strand:+ start:892 stop:1839 length:948 start_codon:yes stop_codon:yes gene_type:complete
MINCKNTFGKLKEIILGDVDESVIQYCDNDEQERLKYIFHKTKTELNNFQKILEGFNVKVYRPNSLPNTTSNTPLFQSKGTHIPLCPRDIFFIIDNIVIENATYHKERFFETWYYRDIFLEQFKTDCKWLSMPMTTFNVDNPFFDGASAIRYDKNIFVSSGSTYNSAGLTWMKRTLDNYNFHIIDNPKINGHLDAHFAILRPGLIWSRWGLDQLPEQFKDWDIIKVNEETDKSIRSKQKLIDLKVQDDDFHDTVLAVNTLSIDENTICLYDHYKHDTKLINALNKHKVEIVWVPFTYSHFFNQGLTCITLDLHRL